MCAQQATRSKSCGAAHTYDHDLTAVQGFCYTLSCVQQSDSSHLHSFGCFHISLDLGSADSARFRADFDDGGGGIGIDSIADRMKSAMSE